jgi:hypothetical protein
MGMPIHRFLIIPGFGDLRRLKFTPPMLVQLLNFLTLSNKNLERQALLQNLFIIIALFDSMRRHPLLPAHESEDSYPRLPASSPGQSPAGQVKVEYFR